MRQAAMFKTPSGNYTDAQFTFADILTVKLNNNLGANKNPAQGGAPMMLSNYSVVVIALRFSSA